MWMTDEERKIGTKMQVERRVQAADWLGEAAMIKVLIADDHEIVRKGLKRVMEEEPDMEVAGEAGSAAEMLWQLRRGRWDVLVLDISLPDRSGLDALKEVKSVYPELPILILSMHPESQYAKQALRDGASGYVTKGGAVQEVVEAVRVVAGGGSYVSASLADELYGEG